MLSCVIVGAHAHQCSQHAFDCLDKDIIHAMPPMKGLHTVPSRHATPRCGNLHYLGAVFCLPPPLPQILPSMLSHPFSYLLRIASWISRGGARKDTWEDVHTRGVLVKKRLLISVFSFFFFLLSHSWQQNGLLWLFHISVASSRSFHAFSLLYTFSTHV